MASRRSSFTTTCAGFETPARISLMIAAGASVRLAGPANLVAGFAGLADALTRAARARSGDAAGSARLVATIDAALEGVERRQTARLLQPRGHLGEQHLEPETL